MEIKGVYDKNERKAEARKRRKHAERMKIVGEYEPRFAPRIAEQTLGELFLDQKDVYALKAKKTAGQVWNEFKNSIEQRADELDESFVEAVRAGGEENVECVYLPVVYHFIKKQYNAEKDYEVTGRFGPYYFSPISEEERTIDFFRNFLGAKGGKLSLDKACAAYYRTDEERTKDDLVDLKTIAGAKVWALPDWKNHPHLAPGMEVTEYKALQTLLFPLWIVSVDYQGKYYHYASDVSETKPINLPKTAAWREKTEVRLNQLKAVCVPLQNVTKIAFWVVAAIFVAALALRFFAKQIDFGTAALYLPIAAALVAGTKWLAPSLPYLRDTQFWRAELELASLQRQSTKRFVLRFVLQMVLLGALLAVLIVDACAVLPLLFTA